MFRTIVITKPAFHTGEAARIAELLDGKCDLVHIRKPGASREEVEQLLKSIDAKCHNRLVLHDHFPLAQQYSLYGVHLNTRNPLPPEKWQGSISRSCHSFEELVLYKEVCDYLSISPVFDSISKQGYNSAFTMEELRHAAANGVIDQKVYALGGVTFDSLPALKAIGFGGAMILGDAW